MIKQERFEHDGCMLVRTYSDDEHMDVKNIETGEVYNEAIDPEDMHRQYEEIPKPEEPEEEVD